ncbi:MAG: hypothetical protein ACRENP_11485 [Longimicrobiales bacterium]
MASRSEPPSDIYVQLRTRVFTVRLEDLGLTPDPNAPIHGVVMETGMDDGVATFLCLADGTVSLYLSDGGGVIGAGNHDTVRSAGAETLALTNQCADDFIAACVATSTYPLPDDGQVFFYLLTAQGAYQARCAEADLEERVDPFTALFENCHAVMAEARAIEEQ